MAFSTPSRLAAVAGLLALTALASCKKDEKTVIAPIAPPVGPAATTPLFTGVVFNGITTTVNGTLVSLRTDTNYLLPGTSEFLQSVRTEEARASFYPGSRNTLVDVGNVTYNGTALNKQGNNAYGVGAGFGLTNSPLVSTTVGNWGVAGASGFANFNYAQLTPYPSYNGTPYQRDGRPIPPPPAPQTTPVTTRQVLLTSAPTDAVDNLIDTREELVFPLGSNISAADSMYVIISNGNERVFVRSTVSSVPADPPRVPVLIAAPTILVVPTSVLNRLPANGDGTAFLQTVAFRTVVVNVGGRNYAFVKAGVRMFPIKIRRQ